MPNQVKLDIVEKSTGRLKEASGIYFASYTGMSVNQATEFRKLCRETNVNYSITKNTLIKIAAKNAGYEDQFNDMIRGQIAIATSIEDPVAPARIIKEFNKKNNDILKVVGVFARSIASFRRRSFSRWPRFIKTPSLLYIKLTQKILYEK